jgi:hypothetical protein
LAHSLARSIAGMNQKIDIHVICKIGFDSSAGVEQSNCRCVGSALIF